MFCEVDRGGSHSTNSSCCEVQLCQLGWPMMMWGQRKLRISGTELLALLLCVIVVELCGWLCVGSRIEGEELGIRDADRWSGRWFIQLHRWGLGAACVK